MSTLAAADDAVTLGDLVDPSGVFVDGDWVESKDQDPEGNVRLVQLADVGDGEYRNRSSRFLTAEKANELRCTFLESGDLLVARMPDPLGRACVFPGDVKRAVTVVDVAVIRPRNPQVNVRWLMYQLNAPTFRRAVSELQSGSTRQRISRRNLASIPFHLPARRAQDEAVAEIEKQFSRLDEAVTNLERVKANLKRYRAAVLKAAVDGRLVPHEAEIARRDGGRYETGEELLERVVNARRTKWSARGKFAEASSADTSGLAALPEGWVWASTEQLSDFITKGTTPSASKLLDGSGDVQFLKVYNLTFDGSLNHSYKPAFVSDETHNVELARSKVRPGDVLINIVGPPLGQVSVVPAHLPEANINQAIARIRVVEPVSSGFVALAMMCDDIMGWAIRRSKTTVGQANLTLELCRALPLPLPPLAEQQRIVAEVDRRLSIVRGVEAEVDANLKRARALRQAVLRAQFGVEKDGGT